MKDALLEIALNGATSHPMLVNLELARQINVAHGAPVIAAWDVDELSEEWIEACTGFVMDLASLRKTLNEIELIKQHIRSEHNQRKYLH